MRKLKFVCGAKRDALGQTEFLRKIKAFGVILHLATFFFRMFVCLNAIERISQACENVVCKKIRQTNFLYDSFAEFSDVTKTLEMSNQSQQHIAYI